MRDLPTGTVTFLFTDIEGSTRLLDELGQDGYAEALAEHRAALRNTFAEHGGIEVDTQGDAFFYVFSDADRALSAAEAAQLRLARTPISVRIGLHTGDALVAGEGYVGFDVHKAARIAATAHGGQVVVSEATRLASGRELYSLGAHRLKDLTAPEPLWQLGDGEFPQLASLDQTNLPVQLTPLIGRERELAEAGELLRSARVVTVVGPGGSGKTRLALQVAAEAVGEFSHGVWWVSLQALREPELVLPTISSTLGAKVNLSLHLAGKQILLVLDNLEQLLDAAPALAALLAQTTELRVLCTSREPLRIAGEAEFAIDPLAEQDAVELFCARAAVSEPLEAVREIVRRLDHLPLAIELAAARTKLLPPTELLARLAQRLPLLTGGARDAPERQRTLRATVEWSHDLLARDEQELFARLAVFAGSFDLEAAEAVVDADLDSLQALVERSLVRRWASARLGMLETIREYALERLEESGEAEGLRQTHARYYLSLAESANLASDAQGEQRHALVIPERGNIRAALGWSLDHDRGLGLELLVALENLWATSAPEEGHTWAAALLENADGVPDRLRARALRVYGGMANLIGEKDLADAIWEQSLEIFRALGDEQGIAIILHRLSTSTPLVRRDWARTRSLAEDSLERHRRIGDRKGETQNLAILAIALREEGDLEGACTSAEQSIAIADDVGFRWWAAGARAIAATVLLALGRTAEARTRAREALSISHEIADRTGIPSALALLVEIDQAEGDARRAGTLFGAVEAEVERTPTPPWLFAPIERERILAGATPEFEQGRAGGWSLPLDDALALALADDGEAAPGSALVRSA